MDRRQKELHAIKTIPPERILSDLSIPFVKRSSYIEALAIWRGDKRPSISIQQNELGEWLWHDFGSGKGGSWIDLLMEFYDWDYLTAVRFLRERYLEGEHLSFPERPKPTPAGRSFKLVKESSVSHPALVRYLRGRKIEKIPEWLRELHYEVRGKRYFGLAVKTAKGGWAVRNPLGKWTLGKNSYSLIKRGSSTLAVFEGLFDALSWEQLEPIKADLLILNSTANLKGAFPVIESYSTVITALDNDEAGELARREIEKRVETLRLSFDAEDLNQALVGGKQIRLERKFK